MQESIEMFKLERGAKAITSIDAASWFPVNTSSNFQICESVSGNVSIFKIFLMDMFYKGQSL